MWDEITCYYRCFRPTRMSGILTLSHGRHPADRSKFISHFICRLWYKYRVDAIEHLAPGGGHLSLVWRSHHGIGN